MTSSPYARIAAKLVQRARAADDGPPPHADDRARAIVAIEEAIRVRARRRTQRRVAVALIAAAAAVALAVGAGARRARAPGAPFDGLPGVTAANVGVVASPVGTGARVVAHDGEAARALADGNSLARGARVVGHAVIELSTGTRLALEPDGDLTVLEHGPTLSFALSSGSLQADVAKLGPNQRFLVSTRDAEISVRGTSFRVEYAPSAASCHGTRTRVAVREGVVAVRVRSRAGSSAGAFEPAEIAVHAGESWPAACAPDPLKSAAAGTPAPREAPERRALPSATAHAAAPHREAREATALAGSRLAAQNDLFAAATAARRAGDTTTALAAYEKLLATYPDGPLVESAAAEQMKLLRTVDRARATEAARRYLARFPDGFARVDAEAIARGGT